jgi:hypothetical protein
MCYGILPDMLLHDILMMITYGLEEVSDNIGIELVTRNNWSSRIMTTDLIK